MLPLGQRVQKKLEALIDKHMSTLSRNVSSIALQRLTNARRFKVGSFFNIVRVTVGKEWPLKLCRIRGMNSQPT